MLLFRYSGSQFSDTLFHISLGFAVVDLSVYTPITVFNPEETSFVLLTLPEGLLKPGLKYRFKLTVYNGSEEGVASMDVDVRTGPTSGLFSVEPTSVQALDTVTMSGEQKKKKNKKQTKGRQ